jgi:hypothetical protein
MQPQRLKPQKQVSASNPRGPGNLRKRPPKRQRLPISNHRFISFTFIAQLISPMANHTLKPALSRQAQKNHP